MTLQGTLLNPVTRGERSFQQRLEAFEDEAQRRIPGPKGCRSVESYEEAQDHSYDKMVSY